MSQKELNFPPDRPNEASISHAEGEAFAVIEVDKIPQRRFGGSISQPVIRQSKRSFTLPKIVTISGLIVGLMIGNLFGAVGSIIGGVAGGLFGYRMENRNI